MTGSKGSRAEAPPPYRPPCAVVLSGGSVSSSAIQERAGDLIVVSQTCRVTTSRVHRLCPCSGGSIMIHEPTVPRAYFFGMRLLRD